MGIKREKLEFFNFTRRFYIGVLSDSGASNLTRINPATITDVSHSSAFFLIYTALKWGFDFIGHL